MTNSFRLSFFLLVCVYFASSFALAQRTPDAGALQQSLQRQTQTPSALGLPQPSAPTPAQLEFSKNEILFTVKRITLTGVKLVKVEEIEDALKPWLNRQISLAELQKGDRCD